MVYFYLIGVGFYAFLWSLFYILRKDLRKKLFFSSLFAAPLGLSEIFFIPGYWVPKFQVIPIFENLFLESILFTFFLGGVVATFYQILFKEKLFKFKKINPLLTLVAPVLFLLYFLRPFKINLIFYVFISMFIGSFIVFLYLGKELTKKIFFSALINTVFYSIFFFYFWHSFQEIPASYQLGNLSGILIFSAPIEEFLWISSFSLYWAPLYEIWRKYFKDKYS